MSERISPSKKRKKISSPNDETQHTPEPENIEDSLFNITVSQLLNETLESNPSNTNTAANGFLSRICRVLLKLTPSIPRSDAVVTQILVSLIGAGLDASDMGHICTVPEHSKLLDTLAEFIRIDEEAKEKKLRAASQTLCQQFGLSISRPLSAELPLNVAKYRCALNISDREDGGDKSVSSTASPSLTSEPLPVVDPVQSNPLVEPIITDIKQEKDVIIGARDATSHTSVENDKLRSSKNPVNNPPDPNVCQSSLPPLHIKSENVDDEAETNATAITTDQEIETTRKKATSLNGFASHSQIQNPVQTEEDRKPPDVLLPPPTEDSRQCPAIVCSRVTDDNVYLGYDNGRVEVVKIQNSKNCTNSSYSTRPIFSARPKSKAITSIESYMKTVVASCLDGSLTFFNKDLDLIKTVTTSSPITCTSLYKKILYFGCESGRVLQCDLQLMSIRLYPLKICESAVSRLLAFNYAGRIYLAVACGAQLSIRTATGNVIWSMSQQGFILGISLLHTSTLKHCVFGFDKYVTLVELNDLDERHRKKCKRSVKTIRRDVQLLSSHQSLIVTAESDNFLHLYTEAFKEVWRTPMPHGKPLCFTITQKYVVVSTSENAVVPILIPSEAQKFLEPDDS